MRQRAPSEAFEQLRALPDHAIVDRILESLEAYVQRGAAALDRSGRPGLRPRRRPPDLAQDRDLAARAAPGAADAPMDPTRRYLHLKVRDAPPRPVTRVDHGPLGVATRAAQIPSGAAFVDFALDDAPPNSFLILHVHFRHQVRRMPSCVLAAGAGAV